MEPMNWPAAVVLIGFTAFAAFGTWIMFKSLDR